MPAVTSPPAPAADIPMAAVAAHPTHHTRRPSLEQALKEQWGAADSAMGTSAAPPVRRDAESRQAGPPPLADPCSLTLHSDTTSPTPRAHPHKQGHPAAAIEAADTPRQALDVAAHRRDTVGACEEMQHITAETPPHLPPSQRAPPATPQAQPPAPPAGGAH